MCRCGAPVTQGHSCETPLIPQRRVIQAGGWSSSAAQSSSFKSFLERPSCCWSNDHQVEPRWAFQYFTCKSLRCVALIKVGAAVLIWLSCDTIHTVGGVMRSAASPKGFTDYGLKPLPSPQKWPIQARMASRKIEVLSSLENIRLEYWFRMRGGETL